MVQIEIDQSWKIERTNRDTIIAFSDGESGAIRIPAKVKRSLFVYLEEKFGRTKLNVFRIFAASVLILLKKSNLHLGRTTVIIDCEYPGRDEEIKSMLLEFGNKAGFKFDPKLISFTEVGKKSAAHFIAYGVFSRKRKAEYVATLHELIKILP